jgi:hypothetical protein
MQLSNADLRTARSFVVGRIEEAAVRAGDPLDEEERDLLNNMPLRSHTTILLEDGLLPRDFDFEKLCDCAKLAHAYDLSTLPKPIAIGNLLPWC